MAELDLEVVRWKTANELDPDEQNFLREHKDDLNEEELAAFKGVLSPQEENEDNEIVEEKDDEDKSEDGETAGEENADDDKKEEPTEPKVLKTQEEIDAYVKEQIEARERKREEERKLTREEKELKKKADQLNPSKWFEEGYKPENPNEFAEVLVGKFKEATQVETRLQQLNRQKVDRQYQLLEEEGKVPTRTTEEGQEVFKKITDLAIKHGRTSYAEAYDLYTQIPTELGGDYQAKTAEATQDDKDKETKAKLKAQKKAASKVGGSQGDDTKTKQEFSYSEMHNANTDEWLEKARG